MRARKEERNHKILEDRKNGMYFRELAEKYGISKARARNICLNQMKWNHEQYQAYRKNEGHSMACERCGHYIYAGSSFCVIYKANKVTGYLCENCMLDDLEVKT